MLFRVTRSANARFGNGGVRLGDQICVGAVKIKGKRVYDDSVRGDVEFWVVDIDDIGELREFIKNVGEESRAEGFFDEGVIVSESDGSYIDGDGNAIEMDIEVYNGYRE